MAGQFYAMESGVLCQCFNSTRKLPDGVGHSTSSHLEVCQMPSATLPDNLQLETIPEPANIVRHRCLKDGAYYCYCAYVLRISRYSDFLSPMLTNTGIFLRGLKLSGESRS